jgi:choline dehydrogenase-like flavoprotein
MNVVSSHGGLRTTSASAYLAARKPHNLTIWTESSVARVILDGKRAIGVETADSRKGIQCYVEIFVNKY